MAFHEPGLEALKRGAQAGEKSTSEERYEIVRMIEQGDEVALEVFWTARLNVPIGKLAAGDIMRAHLGIFLTWRDGKIVSQHNYDCYDPF